MYQLMINIVDGSLKINDYFFDYEKFSEENLFLINLANLFDFSLDYINNKRRYRIEVLFFKKKFILYFVYQDGVFFSLSSILVDIVGWYFSEYDHDGNLKLITKDFESLYARKADYINELGFIYFNLNWGVTKLYCESKSSMVFWNIKYEK